MTLDLRQVVDDADLPPFQFIDLDGEDRTLPHMGTLTPRQGMLALDGDLELVLRGDPDRDLPGIAPDVADLLLNLPNHAVERLMRDWMSHSDIDPGATAGASGKPPGRSRSSGTTRTPSKRTSRSAGSSSKR